MRDRLRHYLKKKAVDFGKSLAEVTKGGLRNPFDPQAGMNANRADEREERAREAMALGRDTHRKGRGPSTTVVQGALTDVVVVDKGQEYDQIQAATATNERGAPVAYFDVDARPIAVINTKEGVQQWIAAHQSHLIVRSLAVGNQSGDRGGTSNEIATDPAELTIGLVASKFVGIWDDSERYEIIDPTVAVAKLVGQGASLGVGAAVTGPAAVVLGAAGDTSTAVDIVDRVRDGVVGDGEPDSDLVVVEFHPGFATGITKEKGESNQRLVVPCDERVTDADGRTLAGISVVTLANAIEGLIDSV